MKEAHIHAAATELQKRIVVFDDRKQHKRLLEYQPGFVGAQHSIKRKRAEELRRSNDVLWVHLAPGHFSAMRPH